MNTSQIYIAISIVVLAIIAIVMFFVRKNKPEKRLSALTSLAFAFILAGIFFGQSRLIGYSLLGIGVLLAVVDMVKKSRK